MIYRWLADGVALLHAAFVVFVILGGLLALRWQRVAWLHVPAAVWGALIEFAGWMCPLTPLENAFRARAGGAGYSGGFVEHYVLRALYPAGLTPAVRWTLGALVVIINVSVYAYLCRRKRRNTSL
ncbi:MAG TPA: DUF2784 domain-containing protein [Gemmatimonadaceae bacterium]